MQKKQFEIFVEPPDCCERRDIELAYIKPGKPQQNGFFKRFNDPFRREFLDVYLFENSNRVRDMSWVRYHYYNDERPQENLGGLPPSVYRQKLLMKYSNLELSH